MIVKYIRERKYTGEDPHHTLNKNYIGLSINFTPNYINISLRSDDDNYPILLELKHFDFVNTHIPPNWVMIDFGEGYYRLTPQEFTNDFWDLYHDGNPDAEKLFEKVYRELQIFHGIEPDPIPVEPVKEEHPFAWSDKWLHDD